MSLKVLYVNPWGGFDADFARNRFFLTHALKDIDPDCEISVLPHGSVQDITRYDLAISIYHPSVSMKSVNAARKIAFTGESYDVVANTPDCDAYIGFDLEEDHDGRNYRYFRFPLYAGYHMDYCVRHGISSFQGLREKYSRDKIAKVSAVVSNPSNAIRNQVLNWLIQNSHCDSGGRVLNTVGSVDDKLDFTANYAVGMAFENLPKRAYITEKIYEVYAADSVPFYFGAPDIAEEFNPDTFLSLDISGDPMPSVERVLSVMRDPTEQKRMKSIDPCEGYRSERYIRGGRKILSDIIRNVLETK